MAETDTLLRDLSDAGAAILLYTSDLNEIQLVCDRAIVIYRGQIVAEIAVADADEPTLLRAAHNLKSDAPLPEDVAAAAIAAEDASVTTAPPPSAGAGA